MRWSGPFRVEDLLRARQNGGPLPPVTRRGIYLVSMREWRLEPGPDSRPLYLGGLTGKSRRFRTRVGDLLIDLLGFYDRDTGHSSGGQSLDAFCARTGTERHNLWVGWATGLKCGRCAEVDLYLRLRPSENKNRPPRCDTHGHAA